MHEKARSAEKDRIPRLGDNNQGDMALFTLAKAQNKRLDGSDATQLRWTADGRD